MGSAGGIAEHLFRKFPHANTYRGPRRTPGSISAHPPPASLPGTPTVLNLYAQGHPGGPSLAESSPLRLLWFESCIAEVLKLAPPSIAFPHGIGCGIANGNWPAYRSIISGLARSLPTSKVIIVRKRAATPANGHFVTTAPGSAAAAAAAAAAPAPAPAAAAAATSTAAAAAAATTTDGAAQVTTVAEDAM